MKVKELLKVIQESIEDYGEDFLNWDVAVEHHKNPKKCPNCKNDILKDSEDWEYIKTHGFNTFFKKEKVFTINIHY